MELKSYQQRVIKDLTDFLGYLEELKDIRAAFRTYWVDRGATRMEGYKNNVPGVPHVCVKVPTAGGKTFLAANALKPIFDVVAPESTGQPRVVVWLVPSLTILEQTERNFADPTHPYRQRLNTHFKGRVEIYGKKSLLQGAGFSPDAIQGQLSLILMSFDSLRARNKDDRKIFQENGNLATFDVLDADWLPSADPTALINVIRALRLVVVVDESHNAESDLSVEMLVNLKPGFILDLTATPRNNSNIVSFVDALALKKECMVKLPVIVYNRPDKTEVVNNALQLRRKLETLAIAEEKITGKYIRPIILFQAEPKTGEEKETFQKIKATLVKLKIPEAQIAIKTADVNELKGVDLMSRDCPVRYIITVNALKEGWDCPFAYILASLADKSSAVDVEQVVGRVLRQPHVVAHQEPLLNAHILSLPHDSQVKNMAARLAEMIGNMYPIADREIRAYIKRIMEGLTAEQLHDCLERDYSYVAKIKQKISELSTDYCEKVFGDWLTTEKIITSPSFKLPEFIAPSLMGPTIANSLYMSEKKANGFEERVINDIANLPNIQFWHRNIEKTGFRINGFINHYPDFIVRTTSGKIIILETKGDDRDNSDSVRKLKLSNAWEKQAGRQFHYSYGV